MSTEFAGQIEKITFANEGNGYTAVTGGETWWCSWEAKTHGIRDQQQ